jgi:hypothetical protein
MSFTFSKAKTPTQKKGRLISQVPFPIHVIDQVGQ